MNFVFTGSFIWKIGWIMNLCLLPHVRKVTFDQCCYGLSVDGYGLNMKPTTVATNKKEMCRLSAKCPGQGPHHIHSVLLGGHWTSKSENYPHKLAVRIAQIMMWQAHSKRDIYIGEEIDWEESPQGAGSKMKPEMMPRRGSCCDPH